VKFVFIIWLILLLGNDTFGQIDTVNHPNDTLPNKFYVLENVERDGQALPEVEIKEVTIVARPTSANAKRSDFRRYQRLTDNIKKVYPYALMVRRTLGEVNEDLKGMKTERERKEYMKDMEKKVFGEYEYDMRNMTFTQAKLLIKLIDRETQNTSYDLIRDYRGKLSAAFWQGIARIFGTNLKDEYDPFGEDALIELIIYEIEAGRI
jgi:lipopolysaccharide export LptBFGC system permease protein LptF